MQGRRYVVGNFYFRRVDDKSVLDQAQEVQNLVAEIIAEGIPVDARLQVSHS